MTKLRPALDPEICDCRRSVLDPEIGINIVDLGLVLFALADVVDVKSTMDQPGVPVWGSWSPSRLVKPWP